MTTTLQKLQMKAWSENGPDSLCQLCLYCRRQVCCEFPWFRSKGRIKSSLSLPFFLTSACLWCMEGNIHMIPLWVPWMFCKPGQKVKKVLSMLVKNGLGLSIQGLTSTTCALNLLVSGTRRQFDSFLLSSSEELTVTHTRGTDSLFCCCASPASSVGRAWDS